MLSAKDLASMQRISPFRHQRLFNEFLPVGYKLTTLDTVERKEEVVRLKVILGTLITLYDDFADRPDRLNSGLLQELYKIPFEGFKEEGVHYSPEEMESLHLAQSLFDQLKAGLKKLPNYFRLIQIFNFDLKQFFLANHYSELLTKTQSLSNLAENRLYLHHNMGIVMAGMIDLMALDHFEMEELGPSRSLFLLGQRAGRISNILTTYQREKDESDVTNELLSLNHLGECPTIRSFEEELDNLLVQMSAYVRIKGFSVGKYREGIEGLHQLHIGLQGVI